MNRKEVQYKNNTDKPLGAHMKGRSVKVMIIVVRYQYIGSEGEERSYNNLRVNLNKAKAHLISLTEEGSRGVAKHFSTSINEMVLVLWL
jgi:hypothetical protein